MIQFDNAGTEEDDMRELNEYRRAAARAGDTWWAVFWTAAALILFGCVFAMAWLYSGQLGIALSQALR
jgi:hypothetical protein